MKMSKTLKQYGYLQNKEKTRTQNNSSMAQNMDEIKKLGKEMDAVKTGNELQKGDRLTSDPIQSKLDTEEERKEDFWGDLFVARVKYLYRHKEMQDKNFRKSSNPKQISDCFLFTIKKSGFLTAFWYIFMLLDFLRSCLNLLLLQKVGSRDSQYGREY
jgi:hypothetical protein